MTVLMVLPSAVLAQEAVVAWFTDANIPDSVKSGSGLSAVQGTVGSGVNLTKPAAIDASPVLNQKQGMISFWIKPDWKGSDNKQHVLLKIGDPSKNGILIEKSTQNMLRFVMASPSKITASRADVSSWTPGRWHHVACSWTSLDGKPIGIGIWIDKICEDSKIFGGDAFMNPATMADRKVYVGDKSSKAVMDELIIRNDIKEASRKQQIDTVYRDYFRTAPYTEIKIDPNASIVASDPRVVLDAQKQFGLQAKRVEGDWERITNFEDARYHPWSVFDTKPFTNWSVEDTSIAVVDNKPESPHRGMVTGKTVGNTTLTAELDRGSATPLVATYPLTIISWDRPDLDIMWVERYPRYTKDGTKEWDYGGDYLNPKQVNEKYWPDEGETVTSVVHYGNYGFQPSSACKLKFELISDDNENFVADSSDTVKYSTEADVASLAPGETATKTFTWAWPRKSQGEHQVFVRVTIDPDNAVDEICEANNQRCELSTAQAHLWGYDPKLTEQEYKTRQINYIGSFCSFDWTNAEIDREALLLRESVLPTTSPVGVKDSIRVDDYEARTTDSWDNEPYRAQRSAYYDDEFFGREPRITNLLEYDAAEDHEITHGMNTYDLYGHPHVINNIFLKDENGNAYAGTQVYPALDESGNGFSTKSTYDRSDMLWFGYTPMMDACHMWLDQYTAGIISRNGGERNDDRRSITTPCPKVNKLRILDINDKPLKNAAVYAYQLTEPVFVSDWDFVRASKYIADRPKFVGNTDSNGYWTIPTTTDPDWDDLETDEVEGAMKVSQPFAMVKREYDTTWFCFGGYFVLKIVSNGEVEFSSLTQHELFNAYMSGNTDTATYTIKTSLTSSASPTPIRKPVIPDAIRKVNLKPVAVIKSDVPMKEITADGRISRDIYLLPGQSFTLDASASYDPEGQPLIYRWSGFGDNYGIEPPFSVPAVRKATAPKELGDYRYDLYVLDGLRSSDVAGVTVHVVNTLPDTAK